MRFIHRYNFFLLFFNLAVAGCSANETGAFNNLPKDDEEVSMPVSEGIQDNNKRFETLGYQIDDKVPDFTLYSSQGDKFTLSEALKSGKPIMLISGSYTCDVSRSNLPGIDSIIQQYRDKINVRMVYTLDAHPSDTISPYSPKHEIWIPNINLKDQVEATQPKTYGEREALAVKWQQRYNIAVPVLIDTPANQFWLNYGQAPNMVYLIDPNGTVNYKQVWFNKNNLEKAIIKLIN